MEFRTSNSPRIPPGGPFSTRPKSEEAIRPVTNFHLQLLHHSTVPRRPSPLGAQRLSHHPPHSADGHPVTPRGSSRVRPKSFQSKVPSPLSTTIEIEEIGTNVVRSETVTTPPGSPTKSDETSLRSRRSSRSLRSILSLSRSRSNDSSSATSENFLNKASVKAQRAIPPMPHSPYTPPRAVSDPTITPFPSKNVRRASLAAQVEVVRKSPNRSSMTLYPNTDSRNPAVNWITAQPSTTPTFTRKQLNATPIVMPLSKAEVETKRMSMTLPPKGAVSGNGNVANRRKSMVEPGERRKSWVDVSRTMSTNSRGSGHLNRSSTLIDRSSIPTVNIVPPESGASPDSQPDVPPPSVEVEKLRELANQMFGPSTSSVFTCMSSGSSASAYTIAPSSSVCSSTTSAAGPGESTSASSSTSSVTSLDTAPPCPPFYSSECYSSASSDCSSDTGSSRSSMEASTSVSLSVAGASMSVPTISVSSSATSSARTLISPPSTSHSNLATKHRSLSTDLPGRRRSSASLSTLVPRAFKLSSKSSSLPVSSVDGGTAVDEYGRVLVGTSPSPPKKTKTKKGWRRWFS